jgi:hypothetical protein
VRRLLSGCLRWWDFLDLFFADVGRFGCLLMVFAAAGIVCLRRWVWLFAYRVGLCLN